MSDRHYSLALTPLSPVHMGTDADYEPTGYVIDQGALFEFDAVAALDSLPEAERKRLDRILDGRPDDAMLRQVQGFFYDNRERLIGHSRRQVRVGPTIETFYKERVGKVAQHEQGGRKVQNRLEMERTAWNPVSGQPFLPGSGLKGAIRTALLDRENKRAELPRRLKDPHARDGSGVARNANSRLQNDLFHFRPGKFELDPMRLVRVGDAALRDGIDLPTEVLFALNRKKRPVQKNGTLVQSQAEQQGLYQLLECLPPLFDRPFAGTLTVQDLDGVGDERNTPKLRFGIEDIAAACNRFYRSIFDRELALLRERCFVDADWASRIEQLLQKMQPDFDAGRAFLLRVGRHSGAEAVTLEGVRRIRIMKGRGESPDWSDSPKTLWLAGRERQAQRDLLPFGWLLVEIDAEGSAPWSVQEDASGAQAWLTQVRERVGRLAEESALQRAKEEQRQRQQAEEAARREAAEAALASMSAEQQQIEALRRVFEAESAQGALSGGCQTADLRIRLLRAALTWDEAALRKQAAMLIRETLKALPWSRKQKKQGIADELAKLEEGV